MATYRRINGSTTSASLQADWGAGVALATGDLLYTPYGCSISTDLAVLAAVNLNRFVVENGIVCNIGTSSGTPLEVLVNNGATPKLQYLGAGEYAYLKGTFAQVEWSPSAATQLTFIDSTVKILVVSAGSVTIDDGTDLDAAADILVTGGSLTIEAKAASVINNIQVNGGSCVNHRDFTTAGVGGTGRLVHDAPGITAGTVTLNGGEGSVFIWVDGDLAAIVGKSGVLDYATLRTPSTVAALTDTPGLTEIQAVGSTQPVITARTTYGRGSRKKRG